MGALKAWSSIHISNPLSLSKKSERKSKEFKVGTYILLEIDWSEQWEVESWSEDKVWFENLNVKRYFNFGGFDDLGVLKFLFDDCIFWGFHSSCYSWFGGFHFQKSLGAKVLSCYFFHAYFEGFYGRWNNSVKNMHIPKVTVKRGE